MSLTSPPKCLAWYATLGIIAILTSPPAHAFGTAAHVVVMEKVTNGLPESSRIRQAMASHAAVAAAGACGPDINYATPRVVLGYAPWAERFHYQKVGTFAATQLRSALAADDPVQVAWAAGWITHVAGDLACHGLYVNPEAGVYLDNPAGRDLHQRLEHAADAYAWVDLGGHPRATYTPDAIADRLCSPSLIPLGLLRATSKEVYDTGPGDGFRTWYSTYISAIKSNIAGTYMDYGEALEVLAKSDRTARLRKAVDRAVEHAVALLTAAERGDYSGFSDAWNLDVGEDDRPIGSLTVTVHTGTKLGAGTNADIYFGMRLPDGTEKRWLLDHEGYDDFENGDTDDYYLYVPDKAFDPANIDRIWIEMGDRGHALTSPGPDWQCDWIIVWINGHATRHTVKTQFKRTGDRWETDPRRADRVSAP